MLEQMGKAAREASWQLAQLSTKQKNAALEQIADLLEQESATILEANAKDIEQARANGMTPALQDRLLLTQERLKGIADDVRKVCQLADPVGQVIDGSQLDNGLNLQRRRVPLGVVGVIYEARPNVTVDVAALCLKTGNAAILRGGKETHNTNLAVTAVIQKALKNCGISADAIQAINNPDRELVAQLLKLDRYVDMLIPRGGAGLHKLCREQSTIPVITGGIGVCHTFVDQSVNFDKAISVLINAKVQRPSACNSLETVLVHEKIAAEFLPVLSQKMAEQKVTLHASVQAMPYLKNGAAKVVEVLPENLVDEWLSLDLNVEVVSGIDAAIDHIRTYGTAHSDAILTESISQADYFIQRVDSAAVYVNASTRFTDGGQFGLGAEVAVSTQKLHSRGPMGLDALTTYKWIGYGDFLNRA
ncbi:glutamate-5-semialdehyde dehydrogenase [Providencia manganoxydans]|uniref:Gamma-glutamyl phosphate reductase n=2 Tax=Providencia TaxID=586 RepID=A0A1S1HQP5_PROST|nr:MULTISPECIES: glutamate-5-semialdehyde dehydrogenase [Providencia]ELR5038496.1 glutamate-5-semialdehyde dehydrogenase [Providencia stuartii]ELR5084098.1 glutamate-5-semialdehyde dehydrogenase [Providencia stuartii]ELR5084699.1 glutamate-5-semialdehyde dehydrogenase [Providencia stuartii]MDX4945381.1 glutamate-5-semialdehyde dehydrogenase [Providencia manganoxydans]OHT24575.1 gamma-glutamyl-phosphate reductase [Providencia stuartii]